MSIFKACDIRGTAGTELTPDLYRRLGLGLARMMGPEREIVVGGDVRLSTPELKRGLIDGLCSGGRAVTDLGVAPTPVVYFARRHLRAHACAIVTASHNPPEFNGLKFMMGDLPVLPDELQQLRQLAEADGAETPARRGSVRPETGVLDAYARWVGAAAARVLPCEAERGAPLRIVVDAGSGTFSDSAPAVLAAEGAAVDRLFCVPDGRFPEREPNCAVPAHLKALCSRVPETRADLGVAFDGDGDRVAFVDERGRVVSADEMLVIFMQALPGGLRDEKVVYDLKCSQVVPREAGRLGATPLMERSGHAFIKRRMILEDAFFGGEISGHFFFRELYGGDDGLFAALLALRLLRRAACPLSTLREGVPPRFVTPDVRIGCPQERAAGLLDAVRASFPIERIDELDGIRVSFPNGWALLRASITEPKVTLRFEGADPTSLKAVVDTFLEAVPDLADGVRRALADHDDTSP